VKNQSECPQNMTEYVFEYAFTKKPAKAEKMWELLQLRETFVKSQLFPYKVEFDAPSQKGAFLEGELNIHHGPLMSLHGAIGKVAPKYRDLQYHYGSYILSFRWIRPTRLEFFRDKNQITVRLTYFVRPWIKPFWAGFNEFFWRLFPVTFIV